MCRMLNIQLRNFFIFKNAKINLNLFVCVCVCVCVWYLEVNNYNENLYTL
jgi:hypothetical protein